MLEPERPPCRAPYDTVSAKEKKNRPHQTRAAAALRWCPPVFLLNALALPSFLTGPRAFEGGGGFLFLTITVLYGALQGVLGF